MKLNQIFRIENAKSGSFSNYGEGEVAFITNGDYEASILGYITPFDSDKVFNEKAICLSSFGEATIPPIPFVARGNGGSGLLVLLPLNNMSDEELYSYASQLNLLKWKFNFSRMAIEKRIENLELFEYQTKLNIEDRKKSLLPKKKRKEKLEILADMIELPLIFDKNNNGLCLATKQSALPKNSLEVGETPYVTTSSLNNGISGFFDIEPNSESKCLTVALNGSVGEVFFQFEDFVTSGDNVVLQIKDGYNPYLLFYIATMIKNHQWRYNYYRKLTMAKLKKLLIPVPCINNQIALGYIEKVVKNSYGFKEIKKFL